MIRALSGCGGAEVQEGDEIEGAGLDLPDAVDANDRVLVGAIGHVDGAVGEETLVALGAGFGGARTVSNLREAIKISMRDDATVARTSS